MSSCKSPTPLFLFMARWRAEVPNSSSFNTPLTAVEPTPLTGSIGLLKKPIYVGKETLYLKSTFSSFFVVWYRRF